MIIGSLSERIGWETATIWSYILTGVFLFLTIVAGAAHSETLFVVAVRAGRRSFPRIQLLHRRLQLFELAVATLALRNMRLNLGRSGARIEDTAIQQ